MLGTASTRRRLTVEERCEAVISLPRSDRSMLMDRAKSYLKDRSWRVREQAMRIVRDEGLRELEEHIIAALADKSCFVRDLAIECLGDFHCDERVEMPILYPFLSSEEALTRVETLETLTWIGDKRALPLMLGLLEDEDSLVRSYAAISIAELGGRRYRRRIESASRAEMVETAKAWFARALFISGDPSQFFSLIGFLASSNCTARCAAANALADVDLSGEQTAIALASVLHAKDNFIARSDQSTMERVQERLQDQIEWIKN